jgi:V8-like Glu-specific endopeptidase
MNWIDKVGYPWYLEVAQQLHRNLYKAKPLKEMAMHIADVAGIDNGFLYPDKAIVFLWKDILNAASAQGDLRNLIKTALDQLNANHPFRKFFEDLLASEEGDAPVDAEPVDAEGKPDFIASDDNVTTDEALLFTDDLTLPIGKLPSLIDSLQKLEQLAPAVCRLMVTIGTTVQYGTGFKIGKKTLLTNHHVLHRKNTDEPATAVTAHFGYEDDGAGGFLNGTVFKCNAGSIQSHKENDWAIIMTADELPDAIPTIDLATGETAKLNDQAFIIQHPLSGYKKIGYVRNSVSNVNDTVAHYLTDTQEGSSGAPVFNAAGKIIAVHRAAGRPIQLPGKEPMKKNEGVLVSKILENLTEKHIQVV